MLFRSGENEAMKIKIQEMEKNMNEQNKLFHSLERDHMICINDMKSQIDMIKELTLKLNNSQEALKEAEEERNLYIKEAEDARKVLYKFI